MYNLEFKNGLLFAKICITHNNKKVLIKDVIIDTGSSNTILLIDYLNKLEIGLKNDDRLVVMYGIGGAAETPAVRKKIDGISIGDINLKNMFIDFGAIDPKGRINGLIGMDFLHLGKVVIDTADMILHRKF